MEKRTCQTIPDEKDGRGEKKVCRRKGSVSSGVGGRLRQGRLGGRGKGEKQPGGKL